MKNILRSLALIALIPFIALALEPNNPQGVCARFISDKDIQLCNERTKSEDVDWYASAVCNLQKEDTAFWTCWDSIKGQSFNPMALENCGEDKDLSDSKRQDCVFAARASREPASKDTKFQSLKISK